MKKKIIDKQILSALAIGIGAGIMLVPVTAEAADNDDNSADPEGGSAVNNDNTTTTATETAQAQEYSEAHETAEADVQEAREEIATAAAAVNTTIAQGDPKSAEAYNDAATAISDADDAVYSASQDLSNTENAAEAIDGLITAAEEKDNSLSEKADAAAAAYDAPTNTANEAAGKVENIDVETTSLEDAEAAVAEAEATFDQAEQEKAAADELMTEAENMPKADEDFSAIEAEIKANEEALANAQQSLEDAEADLAAAKDTVDGTMPTQQEKDKLSKTPAQIILNKIDTLSKMSETDADYQDKLQELVDYVLYEYVLSDFDPFYNPDAYRDGDLTFDYSFSNGELTIVLPELKDGYYTVDGKTIDMSSPSVYRYNTENDEYNGVDAVDTADESSFIAAESTEYQTSTRTADSTSWTEYEMIEGTEIIERIDGLFSYEGMPESQGITEGLPKALKFTKKAEFTKTNISNQVEQWTFHDRNEYVQATAEDLFALRLAQLNKDKENDNISFSLDTSMGSEQTPGFDIIIDEHTKEVQVFMYVRKAEIAEETEWLTKAETYKSDYYTYKEGYEEQTVASTTSGKLKKAIDTQKANVQSVQDREAAATANSAAIEAAKEKVAKAKDTVATLQEKGQALFATLREKASQASTNNTIANSKLSAARAAKANAETAIENARQAIVNAATKVNQIKERIEREKAEKEQAEREKLEKEKAEREKAEREKAAQGNGSSDDGSGSGTTTDGGDTTVNPTIDNTSSNIAPVAPTTIPSSTPVLALGTSQRAAVLGASKTQFYKNLSEELTRQLLEQKNAAKETAPAAANTVKEPGDMVKDATVNKTNSDVSIADAETPLAETPADNAPTTPLALALLFAVAAGISVEEYYRRKAKK